MNSPIVGDTTFSVIHSHDGAGDDQLALTLVLTMNKDVLATVLVPGDSFLEPSRETTQKILAITKKASVSFVALDLSLVNCFPDEWRADSHKINDFITFKGVLPLMPYMTEVDDLTNIIMTSPKPIVWLETGPLTALAACLDKEPKVSQKITKLIWMGTSFVTLINGTSFCPGTDGSQEWNAFCDPKAMATVFESDIDITVCTRELCNKVKIDLDFYESLPDTISGNIFKKIYSLYWKDDYYRMWDVLTASYLDVPEIFTTEIKTVSVIAEGEKQGCSVEDVDGRQITVVTDVDKDKFYEYVLEQLSK